MSYLKLEFEKGGVFTARLLEKEAPKTCSTIKEHLPFEYRFHQSIVSGQALVTLPPDLTVERENQRVAGIPPGAHEGTIVNHERFEDGWSLISLSRDKRGWVKSEALERIKMDKSLVE